MQSNAVACQHSLDDTENQETFSFRHESNGVGVNPPLVFLNEKTERIAASIFRREGIGALNE